LIELRQRVDSFTAVEFTVVAEYDDASQKQFGKCVVNFSDLTDQETFKEWLPLTRPNKFKGRPELEVRVQMIVNEADLLSRHLESCEAVTREVQSLLQKERKEEILARTKCLRPV
jgi:hypothetical protein